MAEHVGQFRLHSMCRVLRVQRSGYYAWKKKPKSKRALNDESLLVKIKQSFEGSQSIYGSPRVHCDLREDGVLCGEKRIARLMRQAQLRSVRGYKRPRYKVGAPATTAPNRLQREFTVEQPDQVWVTDITYVWTDEGWCYLAVLLDLYSRAVVGWALDATLSTRLPLAALDMALRRRKPKAGLLHHSDRGCQYTSADYRAELQARGVEVSMSRKGNCWDNAVAESFFSTLKTELVHRHSWSSRLALRAEVFDYIEMFYNRQRLHSTLNYKTPAQVESTYALARAA